MINALKFVQGAVSKKGLVQEMSHFRILEGQITSYNGIIALGSPIDLDFNCIPKADAMLKAIDKCTDVVKLVLKNNKLQIKSGKFNANINCLQEESVHVVPEGRYYKFKQGTELLECFKKLLPIIGTDALRPFCTNILLRGSFAFATNNTVAVQYWLNTDIDTELQIPQVAVKELLRIKKEPVAVQYTDKSLTFHFGDETWLRTALSCYEWPNIEKVIETEYANYSHTAIDSDLFDGLQTVKPFTDSNGKVFIENNLIRTHEDPDDGATYELSDNNVYGVYQIDMLLTLKNIATHGNFNRYPKHAVFTGDSLRGLISGMRL